VADTPQPSVALVTGAGRGIGRAAAIELSHHGLRVALTARSMEQLESTARECVGETLVVSADLTEPQAVDHIFSTLEQTWAPVDVLVANAGVGTSARVHKTSDEQWQRMLDLNLTAPFRCVRRAVPAMVDRGYGRIVAVASIAARRGEPYIAAYAASKHGLLGLVRSTAAELATTGVTVNAVCPAYVDTPMTDQTVRGIAERTGRSEDEARAILERKQPHGRLVTPEEVASAVWFCIDNGSVSGQAINVDGGAVQS
jgi:NAD(P)-dependent dehydrogenase (short-subunit alcohol dehydrogenase family)